MGQGPTFAYLNEYNLQAELKGYWWTYFIFMSNFIPWDAFGGLFWITYIANDLLFFSLILMPCIYLYRDEKKHKFIYIMLGIIIGISIVYVLVYTFVD